MKATRFGWKEDSEIRMKTTMRSRRENDNDDVGNNGDDVEMKTMTV